MTVAITRGLIRKVPTPSPIRAVGEQRRMVPTRHHRTMVPRIRKLPKTPVMEEVGRIATVTKAGGPGEDLMRAGRRGNSAKRNRQRVSEIGARPSTMPKARDMTLASSTRVQRTLMGNIVLMFFRAHLIFAQLGTMGMRQELRRLDGTERTGVKRDLTAMDRMRYVTRVGQI